MSDQMIDYPTPPEKRYVKKRIPVRATQVENTTFPFPEREFKRLQAFTNDQFRYQILDVAIAPDKQSIQITDELFQVYDHLHDTWVNLKRGDWIIEGVEGEFYPCEESVFAKTYEEYKTSYTDEELGPQY